MMARNYVIILFGLLLLSTAQSQELYGISYNDSPPLQFTQVVYVSTINGSVTPVMPFCYCAPPFIATLSNNYKEIFYSLYDEYFMFGLNIETKSYLPPIFLPDSTLVDLINNPNYTDQVIMLTTYQYDNGTYYEVWTMNTTTYVQDEINQGNFSLPKGGYSTALDASTGDYYMAKQMLNRPNYQTVIFKTNLKSVGSPMNEFLFTCAQDKGTMLLLYNDLYFNSQSGNLIGLRNSIGIGNQVTLAILNPSNSACQVVTLANYGNFVSSTYDSAHQLVYIDAYDQDASEEYLIIFDIANLNFTKTVLSQSLNNMFLYPLA